MVSKCWRKSPFLPARLHLHIPRAGAPPQDLAFKVPETRILGEPHNPGAPEPYPPSSAYPTLSKGAHTHTPWSGFRTEVMAQLASFSPACPPVQMPTLGGSCYSTGLLLCAGHCSVCPKTKGEGERHSPEGDGEEPPREKGVRQCWVPGIWQMGEGGRRSGKA